MKYIIILLAFCVSSLATENKLRMVTHMYSSGLAQEVGDLVTIIISESSSSSKSESLSTAKTASKPATDSIFSENLEGKKGEAILYRVLNDWATMKGLSINSGSSFDGSGNSSTSETLDARITARVVDVLPNGNLVIKGQRRVKMKQEEVHIVMTGMIRVRDISKINTINSALMSDAHIFYETAGDVTDGAQPGILWRIFQYINPF
ncbi:MAG: flagellar basal body L-ring protein FlgH [Lentisphaeraceae bacterium]|nr:flagellar basal body L-ring protein FlgH [Lentisphaeraceae bacterium]